MRGAIYVENSKNSKIAGSNAVDSTYVAIKHTCPNSCSLKDSSCYAQNSYVGMTNLRMERRAKGSSALEVARAEAQAIDNAYSGRSIPAGRDLRLHVSGDSRTVNGTQLINNAVKRWKKRGGNDCWSYSHAWKTVPRSKWSHVSILASITTVSEVAEARKQGYAPAIIVPEHPSDKVYKLNGSDVKWIPCPAQTRNDISCVSCRLCFNANRLYKDNFGIAFAAHGVKKEQIKRYLKVIQ